MGRIDDAELLFDALTDHVCESHADIAAVTGWSDWKPGYTIHWVREHADELGWTVPPAQRGGGTHLFQVLLQDGGHTLTEDEAEHVRLGSISTLSSVSTTGENQANALRLGAAYVDKPTARKYRNLARVLDGAAAMAAEALESIKH